MEEFCVFADTLIREAFGAADPVRTQLEPDGDGHLCFGIEGRAGDAAGGPRRDQRGRRGPQRSVGRVSVASSATRP